MKVVARSGLVATTVLMVLAAAVATAQPRKQTGPSPVPVVTALTAFALYRALEVRRELAPFVLSLALFLLSFLGLGISLWPHAVPPDITVFEAAAPPATQSFLLIGVVILLPFVLGYQALTYYVFRGKVKPGEGYH